MWLFILIIFICSIIGSLKYHEHFLQPKLNLILITSVIHTVSTPLRFAHGDNIEHNRSMFTHEERYEQTLNTIISAKEKVPYTFIVVLEGSVLTDKEKKGLYEVGCNYIYNVYDDLKDVINSPYKSFAEVNMMLHFLTSQWFTDNKFKFETFSKLSGRYQLTDNFKFNKYPKDFIVAQCADRCNTRYYRIPMDMIDEFIHILNIALNDPEFSNYKAEIEDYNIYKRFKNQNRIIIVRRPDILGVSGFISPYKKIIEDFII